MSETPEIGVPGPSPVVPSTAYQVKVFEAVEATSPSDGGYRRIDAWSTPPLEEQIRRWIRESGASVVAPGPVTLAYHREEFDPKTASRLGVDHMRLETRTIALTYVPPMVEEERIHGQPIVPVGP